jgi:hypothetical protein
MESIVDLKDREPLLRRDLALTFALIDVFSLSLLVAIFRIPTILPPVVIELRK